jgi:hypothetical protein
MLAGEAEQHGRHAVMTESLRHAHTQSAFGLASPRVQIGFCGFEFGQRAHAAVVVSLAVFGEALAARRPIEQAYAETLLQPHDHFADRRARQVHPFRRERETARFDHAHERRHTIEDVAHTLCLIGSH